jgi:flagellar basal-body rod protein FlgG
MIRSLWISKTGLDAQQTQMDVVSNNLANVSTAGFKRSRAVFEDLLYQTMRQPGAQSSQQTQLPSGMQIGTGVRPVASERIFTQGNLQQTGNPLDVAIDGKGFLVVNTPRGERYTRNGSLQIGPTGTLVTSDGFEVSGESGPITLQRTDRNISISAEGTISVREGASIQDTPRGKLRLVGFDPTQASRLSKEGGGLFAAPQGGAAQPEPNSKFVQHTIEKSNVRGVIEITRMIELSRSYTQMATILQQQSDMRTSAIGKLADVPV